MAKIQHKDIPENQLHEPKGASLAPARTFLTAKGDGTTEFRGIQTQDLAGVTLPGSNLVRVADTRYQWSSSGLGYGAHSAGAYISKTEGGDVSPALSPYKISFVQPCNFAYRTEDLSSSSMLVVDDGISTQFTALSGGWYYFSGKVFLTKYSNNTNHYAAVFMRDSNNNLVSSSRNHRMVNGVVSEHSFSNWVYLDEGDFVEFLAAMNHATVVPFYADEDDPVSGLYNISQEPPRETSEYSWQNVVSHMSVYRLGAEV